MPPLHSGDTGDGHGDEDPDEQFVPPLPRDDRLWRHPSEVAAERGAATAGAPGRPPTAPPTPRGIARGPLRTTAMLAASGMIGATMAVGAVALLGGFDERVVSRTVAAPPVSFAAEVDPVAAVAARTAPSVAAVAVHRDGVVAAGSAVVLRSDGHLLTTGHLVAGADRIEVTVETGWRGDATVVGTDPVTDLAVLHIDADDLPTAALGSAVHLRAGMRAVAVGALASGGWDTSVSTGVVSATGQRLERADGPAMHDMILFDGALVPGSAGGALVDSAGAVVGITSDVGVTGGDDVAFGVAVPIDLALHVAEQLMAHGHGNHVWLGVLITDLDPARARAMGLTGAAAVAEVTEDSPAWSAGLRTEDVVVGVDDTAVTSTSELIAALRMHVPGDEVVVWLHRDGDRVPVTIELEAKDRA